MDLLKHLPSPIAPTFSEALRIDTRAGSWIFISGQVGVPLPPDEGSVTFEQEVRTTLERIRNSLGKLGAGMNHVVSITTYLTDLGRRMLKTEKADYPRRRERYDPRRNPTPPRPHRGRTKALRGTTDRHCNNRRSPERPRNGREGPTEGGNALSLWP
jgi:enamine deaminase RidA (YjgF/YER057c/UK114 family)